MSEQSTLSPDAIAALFEAAGDGRLDDQRDSARRGSPRARPLDFRRPRQFTVELQRHLRRMLETFCRTASGALAAELRTVVDLEVINVEQLTWSDALDATPDDAVMAVVACPEIGSEAVLAAELPMVLGALERMMGGEPHPGGLPAPRKLTELELAMAGPLFETMATHLSAAWSELTSAELTIAELVTDPQELGVASPSEPSLAFTVEVRMAAATAVLILVVPYRMVAPLLDRLVAAEAAPTAEAQANMRSAVRGVEMEVRAEVGAVDLPLAAVAAIRPGDVIGLGGGPAAGVWLLVGDVVLERAQPGRSGNRRAVQVMERRP